MWIEEFRAMIPSGAFLRPTSIKTIEPGLIKTHRAFGALPRSQNPIMQQAREKEPNDEDREGSANTNARLSQKDGEPNNCDREQKTPVAHAAMRPLLSFGATRPFGQSRFVFSFYVCSHEREDGSPETRRMQHSLTR